MSQSMEERYVTHSKIQTLSNKKLYYGEDLSLKREVMLYIIDGMETELNEEYLRKFRKASAFVHSGYQHILDTSIEDHTLFIVLEYKSGKPLNQYLKQREWTFNQIVTMISDVGISMLDGMGEQITGFSVGVDNLWLSDDDHLSFINFWEEGQPICSGPLGLCSLIMQLSSGSAKIPDPFTALDSYLEQIDYLHATAEQKSVLIKLVRRAYHGQASLSSLVIGIQGLLHIKSPMDENPSFTGTLPTIAPVIPVAATAPPAIITPPLQQQPTAPINVLIPPHEDEDEEYEDDDEEYVPFYKRKSTMILGLFFAALLIWIIWPNAKDSKTPLPNSPSPSTQSTITPTATATATQAPTPTEDRVVAGTGEETAMPNLIGMKLVDAEDLVIDSGLHYKYTIEPNADTESGTVFKQDPPADTVLHGGDNITFVVTSDR